MLKRQVVVVLLGALCSIFDVASGFLATPVNASDPQLVQILCPQQTTGKTRDHKWITREGIRRNIRQFFIDYPPADKPDFDVPEDATLTQLFHAYYGDGVSPARFIGAVNEIAEANAFADSSDSLKYDPHIQADAEVFSNFHYAMVDRYPQIISSISQSEAYGTARSILGLNLHSLQKFYAHSSWVEQGNKGILQGLGLPGFVGFGDVTDPEEDACTPCPKSQGECKDNIVLESGLTTGYYFYEDPKADGYVVKKPESGGKKCSHGGTLDESAADPAIGGINKDTASPCFSPHYYLHEQAAEMAANATNDYMSVIQTAIGEEDYRMLFNLYNGSTVAIVIDTTVSMGNVIDTVKEQIEKIVQNSPAQLYVLVPFNDPEIGPVTKTNDPDEFLDAVKALKAKGGDDVPEMFWGGLQLALNNTPDYSTIFCFTDADGKDGELMDEDIAVARAQHTKVFLIYSGERMLSHWQSDINDYRKLCDLTGGLFIPSSEFDVNEITPLIVDTIETEEVDILIVREVLATKTFHIPIDDTISSFNIQVVGHPSSCILTDVSGKTYDIMDKTAMEKETDVSIIVYSKTFRALRWDSPSFGMWNLSISRQSGEDAPGVLVRANSSLSWQGGLALLDHSAPHPHYMAVKGNPLSDMDYYIDVNLIGYIESKVKDVDHIDLDSTSGDVLSSIPYSGEIDDEFFVKSGPLPDAPLYMYLYGHLDSGNVFCRVLPILMKTVYVSVVVAATPKDLSAKPGDSTTAKFIVTNYGSNNTNTGTTNFFISGTDDKHFMTHINESANIGYGESVAVFADFTVPATAVPGTVSTVTVTASGITEDYVYYTNGVITEFIVLPPVEDHSGPTCIIDKEPTCEGFAEVGLCLSKNWTAVVTLNDTGSGMEKIYSKPNVYSTNYDPFVEGSNDPINVTIVGSCCDLKADIIGVDVYGNIGECSIDMGDLSGDVTDFRVIDIGSTWALLTWTMNLTGVTVHKYTLVTNNDLSDDVACSTEVCYYNATGLTPCLLQNFTLTPVFEMNGEDFKGNTAETSNTTLGGDLSKPVSGQVDNSTQTTLEVSWIPHDSKCAGMFKVCLIPVGFSDTTVCETTKETSYKFTDLEACGRYDITVTAMDPQGNEGTDSLLIKGSTGDAMPGMPVDMEVTMETAQSAKITWWDPEDFPLCAHSYIVTTKKNEELSSSELLSSRTVLRSVGFTPEMHTFVEEPLESCTNYTFKVYPQTAEGQLGEPAQRSEETIEGDPVPIDYVDFGDVTLNSMEVLWDSEDRCVDYYEVCYYNGYEIDINCKEVYDDKQLSLTDLLECVLYTVTVNTVTPGGAEGDKTKNSQKMPDVTPSAPRNASVVNTTVDTITIQFLEPADHPQCVDKYNTAIKPKDDPDLKDNSMSTPVADDVFKQQVFKNLQGCTDYIISVKATSSSGVSSDPITVETYTEDGNSSAPQQFKVNGETQDTISLVWFEPAQNPYCVKKYVISYGSKELSVLPDGEHFDHLMSQHVQGLSPCTDYTFTLTPYLGDGTSGPPASVEGKTTCPFFL